MPPRQAFTTSEKLALRYYRRDHLQATQKELCAWFESTFKKAIRQVTVSEILSARYSHLETEVVVKPAQKKQRKEQWKDLKSALAEWFVREQYRRVINSDLLRVQAGVF